MIVFIRRKRNRTVVVHNHTAVVGVARQRHIIAVDVIDTVADVLRTVLFNRYRVDDVDRRQIILTADVQGRGCGALTRIAVTDGVAK